MIPKTFEKELMMRLGYQFYLFRVENQLTEKEAIEILQALMQSKGFKREYGL